MKKILFLFIATSIASVFAKEEATSLFNGRDLTGWRSVIDYDVVDSRIASEPTWFVANGAIRTTGTPFGYLIAKRTPKNNSAFAIELEYRWWRETEKPNSGVFFRIAKETGAFLPVCYENQLCRGRACDLVALAGKPIANVKARDEYTAKNPLSGISVVAKKCADSERAFGEWNKLRIVIRDDEFASFLNGVEQNRVKGLAMEPGAIALQAEGGAIEFRDVKLIDFVD